jgi:hypothetical protein
LFERDFADAIGSLINSFTGTHYMSVGATWQQVSESVEIKSPPELVYKILVDYEKHHLQILPREYFKKIDIRSGGIGAGTVLRIEMKILGATYVFSCQVSEPEPGQVIVESNLDGSGETTFLVEPIRNGAAALLTIETRFATPFGLIGGLQGIVTCIMLRRIYRKELAMTQMYASSLMETDWRI